IKAIGTPISSLHRGPNLMAQRFFEEIARETGIFSPRPKCGSQSVWRYWASALGIDPTRRARFVEVHVVQHAQHGHVAHCYDSEHSDDFATIYCRTITSIFHFIGG